MGRAMLLLASVMPSLHRGLTIQCQLDARHRGEWASVEEHPEQQGGRVQRLHDDLDEDAVTEVLSTLRVHSTLYCRTELRAPWGFGVRPADLSIFRVISRGECWLEVDDVEDPVGLQMGDVVLLLTGRDHRLCDDLSSNTEWLDDIIQKTPPARHEPGPSRTSRPSLPCPDPRSPQSFASSRANRQCATSAAADSPSLFHATPDLTVFAVAQRVGYDSEASLTKAFTRIVPRFALSRGIVAWPVLEGLAD
jgi:hypothetical protein